MRTPLFVLRLLATALLLCSGAGAAAAHAVLLEAVPPDGAVVAAAPSSLVLRFNEPVSPIAFRLLDAAGRLLPLPPPVAHDGEMRLDLADRLAEGGYVLTWRVTSSDSHPVTGSLTFAVGAAVPPPGEPATMGEAPFWTRAGMALRWLFYLTLLPTAGAALFAVLVAPLPAGLGRPLARLGVAGIALAVLSIGVRGAVLAGAEPMGILEPAVWRLGAASSLGRSMAASAAGLLLLALALPWTGRTGRGLALAGGLLAVAGFPLTGHAASAAPGWLTIPALGLHTLALAFWTGSLWPLHRLLRHAPATASSIVARFSRMAVAAVALLVLAGTVLAAVQLATPQALLGTLYGRLLLVKLALLVPLLALAADNRRRRQPALARGGADTAAGFGRAIVGEMILAAGILAATAVLTMTPPPRTDRQDGHDHAPATGFAVLTQSGGVTAVIEVDPARSGRNRLVVSLADGTGQPLRPVDVSLDLSLPAAGIAPIRRRPTAGQPGRFLLDQADFPIAGRWEIRIEVLVTDFDKLVFRTEVPIP